MLFMVMHRHDARTEAGQRPSPELVQQMGAFIGEFAATGRFKDGAGLGASRTRTRLAFRDGTCTVAPGPYAGERELPAAALVLKVSTRDAALAWARRYGEVLGTAELEVGKVTEPWDLGMMPEPANPPYQALLVEKADAATEGAGRPAAQQAALAALESEMRAAGVLLRTIRLAPSAVAKRLVFTNHQLRVVDGPFQESKELIGGFALLDLADMDEAIEMTRRYAEILGGTLQVDIRPVATLAP